MEPVPKIPASPAPIAKRDVANKDDPTNLTPVPEMAQRDAKSLPPEKKDGQPGTSSRPILRHREGLNAGLENIQSIVDEVAKLNERSIPGKATKPIQHSELNGK